MFITTLSSREFNQNTSQAKKAAANGPVFITDRGKRSHVLLSITEYERLAGRKLNIIELLGMPPGVEDIDLDSVIPARANYAKPIDLD